jgi:thiol-disulfide isomerase/thioredoxin
LRSSATTKRRFFADLRAAGGLLACALACACSRSTDARPHARAQPAATARSGSTAEPAPSPPATDGAPTGASAASDGDARTLAAERVIAEVKRLGGKGTLVNAWASWCGPCKHEIPMLARLAKDLAPEGVHILLVSLDEPGDHEKAVSFLKERGVTLPLYFAARPLGLFKQGMNPRWPGMLPASFLFDASGRLRYYWGGEAFEEELTPVLSALVAGKPIEGESDAQVAPEGEVH